MYILSPYILDRLGVYRHGLFRDFIRWERDVLILLVNLGSQVRVGCSWTKILVGLGWEQRENGEFPPGRK